MILPRLGQQYFRWECRALIEFKQFQNDALSGFKASSSSCNVFSLWNSLFFVSRSFLWSFKVLWYLSRNSELSGSRCFSFESFRNSCLFKRHSQSNHFLLDDFLIRLYVFLALIFMHSLEVSVRIFIAFSKEIFTFTVFLSIYSLIRIWIGSVRSVFLKFKCEWISQQNCRGNFDNRDLKHRRRRPEVKFSSANLLGMPKVVKMSSSFRRRRNSGRFAVVAKP